MALDLARTRVLLFEQLGSSLPVPFLVVLVFWLVIIFTSFGLFAPSNTTVMATFFVCALSVSGAIFLILELDSSFEGFVQVSSTPLRAALAQVGAIVGDVGGFGVGAHIDWQVIGTTGYAPNPWLNLRLGYRSLNFNYDG